MSPNASPSAESKPPPSADVRRAPDGTWRSAEPVDSHRGVVVAVNGVLHAVPDEAALAPLSDWLRVGLGLTGTKIVCAEGDCGACTVLVGRPRRVDDPSLPPATNPALAPGGPAAASPVAEWVPVDACILTPAQVHARHVVTVEGVAPGPLSQQAGGSDTAGLSALQRAMVEGHASQCGFCTPGFVMSLTRVLLAGQAEGRAPSEADLRAGVAGNLCRCTGYVQIIRSAAAGAAEVFGTTGTPQTDRAGNPGLTVLPDRLIRPGPVWEALAAADARPLHVASPIPLARPVTLAEAVAFRAAHPGCDVPAGGTELGVAANKRGRRPTAALSLAGVPGLGQVRDPHDEPAADRTRPREVTAGGAATWAEIERWAVRHEPEFAEILRRFGSPQIRAAGTQAGNLATASPIADGTPYLLVCDGVVELTGPRGTRQISVSDFVKGCRRTDLAPDELITAVRWTPPSRGELLRLVKASRRDEMDIATVGAAVRLTPDGSGTEPLATTGGGSGSTSAPVSGSTVVGRRLAQVRIAVSGVAATVVRLPATEAYLTGRTFDETAAREAGRIAAGEVSPLSDVRGSADHRRRLVGLLLSKVWFEAAGL